MIVRAWARLPNQSTSKRSSRKRPLKLSMWAFWVGFPGSMKGDAMRIRPDIQDLSGKLWTIVDRDLLGRAIVGHQLIERGLPVVHRRNDFFVM
jgi:hypothetical protein